MYNAIYLVEVLCTMITARTIEGPTCCSAGQAGVYTELSAPFYHG